MSEAVHVYPTSDVSSEQDECADAPIVTPCHDAPLIVLTQLEGPAYMQSDVPSEIMCSADGCFNSWSASGVAEPYNKPRAATFEEPDAAG